MAAVFSVSDLARKYDCPPREISDLLYARIIPDHECPIVGGRRLIPAKLVEIIGQKLAERAKCREQRQEATSA